MLRAMNLYRRWRRRIEVYLAKWQPMTKRIKHNLNRIIHTVTFLLYKRGRREDKARPIWWFLFVFSKKKFWICLYIWDAFRNLFLKTWKKIAICVGWIIMTLKPLKVSIARILDMLLPRWTKISNVIGGYILYNSNKPSEYWTRWKRWHTTVAHSN